MLRSLRSNHGSHVSGVMPDLHLPEISDTEGHPVLAVITRGVPVLDPTRLPVSQVHTCHLIDSFDCTGSRPEKLFEGAGSQSVVVGVPGSSLCRQSEMSGSHGKTSRMSHLKIGSKAEMKRKPLAGRPCLTPLAMTRCPLTAPACSTSVIDCSNSLHRKFLRTQ